jgi:monoamine oxidase
MVDGIPFAGFFGDYFQNKASLSFSSRIMARPKLAEMDVAVVGGGLSGLASLILRQHDTVLRIADRFGGNARAKVAGIDYSLGGVFYHPGSGSFLEIFTNSGWIIWRGMNLRTNGTQWRHSRRLLERSLTGGAAGVSALRRGRHGFGRISTRDSAFQRSGGGRWVARWIA